MGEAKKDFAGDLGGDLLAVAAGLFLVAAEGEFATGADEEFVVAGAVIVFLRRTRAELDDALVGVDFDRADRFEEVGESLGEGVGDFFEAVDGGGGQGLVDDGQMIEGEGEGVKGDQVVRPSWQVPPWPRGGDGLGERGRWQIGRIRFGL